jgi:hypothetical protein
MLWCCVNWIWTQTVNKWNGMEFTGSKLFFELSKFHFENGDREENSLIWQSNKMFGEICRKQEIKFNQPFKFALLSDCLS